VGAVLFACYAATCTFTLPKETTVQVLIRNSSQEHAYEAVVVCEEKETGFSRIRTEVIQPEKTVGFLNYYRPYTCTARFHLTRKRIEVVIHSFAPPAKSKPR